MEAEALQKPRTLSASRVEETPAVPPHVFQPDGDVAPARFVRREDGMACRPLCSLQRSRLQVGGGETIVETRPGDGLSFLMGPEREAPLSDCEAAGRENWVAEAEATYHTIEADKTGQKQGHILRAERGSHALTGSSGGRGQGIENGESGQQE